ncbi:MAG TPA: metal-dependent hydrolase [Mycobacterium sp.]|nr:metal-dependent hydrolase [Mycobacterium sp.]
MLRPHRFDREIDPGPVQIQARKVHFDLDGIPLEWIPGHSVASTMINLFNVVLPTAEHWFVKTFNDALPLADARLQTRAAARVPHAVRCHTLTYFRPGYSPEDMGSTAQAVAYLATSPAARAAHL